MRRLRHNPLFCRTVTLYHPDADAHTVVRTVVHGAYLQVQRRVIPGSAGTRGQSCTLLVIPQRHARYGVDYTLAPGDRFCAGEGPELAWQDWLTFVPGSGAAVAQYVSPVYLRGQLHHVEAGEAWASRGRAHSLTVN